MLKIKSYQSQVSVENIPDLKRKKQNHKAVNLKIVVIVVMLAVLFTDCSNTDSFSNIDSEKNFPTQESARNGQPSFKGSVLKVTKVGNDLKITFKLHAQFFTMVLTEETNGYFELVKNAMSKGLVLNVYLKEGTNEIIKVDKVSAAEQESFNARFKTKRVGVANNLQTVLPDLNTLKLMYERIRNESCWIFHSFTQECIPFRYPVDGCYARAHKMRQILTENGYDCEKQFVYGNLRAQSLDKACCVNWCYHVAVLVSYKDDSGEIQKRIIDPSLFKDGPVTETDWRAACTNSNCGETNIVSYANTSGDTYYRGPKGKLFMYDDEYRNTDCVLNVFMRYKDCTPTPAPDVSFCSF
ncbi:protein-glutamine glutaminase [Flavobacterium cerinum]|uniref:Protein-glutamine glutaminase n=1 Tax=Flavobacterium cerinum TaxID=2502784 RepID=A0ABY5IP94_9FLAO|nr:protein-glutamine glutaminase [Flavobacterium cerinum]UUC44620.1 protein-glutamine glutaminase [Flavobacterium cerinum]